MLDRRSVHVLFLPQVFPPETHPTAIMTQQLARAVVERGGRATVACGLPHHPGGQVYEGFGARAFTRSELAGVTVLRCWHPTSRRRDAPTRAAVLASQSLAMACAAARADHPDIVVTIGPPLGGPMVGAAVARGFGAKLVSVVFDIYPDVAVASGRLRRRELIAAARVAEWAGYLASDKVIVLSEGFRRTLSARGVPERKLEVIPVWLSGDEIMPMSRDTAFRRELGLGLNDFVVLYAGTIGVVSGATVVAEAAARTTNSRVAFVFVGAGEALEAVRDRSLSLGVSNVIFSPFLPRARLAEVQATGDVGLVTLAPGMGRTSVPSKVIGYLAGGRPVVASVDADSDTARCVQGAGGVVVPAGDPDALARAVEALALQDSAPARVAARTAFEREFSADRVMARYVELFASLAGDQ